MVLANPRLPVPRDQPIEKLMLDLVRAIELSLAASVAARALTVELLKSSAGMGSSLQGDEPGPFFSLTTQDREFLSALSIRFENR